MSPRIRTGQIKQVFVTAASAPPAPPLPLPLPLSPPPTTTSIPAHMVLQQQSSAPGHRWMAFWNALLATYILRILYTTNSCRPTAVAKPFHQWACCTCLTPLPWVSAAGHVHASTEITIDNHALPLSETFHKLESGYHNLL